MIDQLKENKAEIMKKFEEVSGGLQSMIEVSHTYIDRTAPVCLQATTEKEADIGSAPPPQESEIEKMLDSILRRINNHRSIIIDAMDRLRL